MVREKKEKEEPEKEQMHPHNITVAHATVGTAYNKVEGYKDQ